MLEQERQVVVTRFRTGYRRHIFHVAHILASCNAMDQSAIVRFLDPDNSLSDTRAALGVQDGPVLPGVQGHPEEDGPVLLGAACQVLEAELNVMGTVGDPAPQSDREDE